MPIEQKGNLDRTANGEPELRLVFGGLGPGTVTSCTVLDDLFVLPPPGLDEKLHASKAVLRK